MFLRTWWLPSMALSSGSTPTSRMWCSRESLRWWESTSSLTCSYQRFCLLSFPNIVPLMYLLFKDGSGRGAALVAAVLKGKGEWPLLHNSSSNSNYLVDHLNQLWLDLTDPISEKFSSSANRVHWIIKTPNQEFQKKTFPNSPPCYTWAWSHNLVNFLNKSGAFHTEPTLSAYSPHCVHLPGHSSTAHAERQARRHFSAKLVSVAKNLCLCAWSLPCLSSSASYILY